MTGITRQFYSLPDGRLSAVHSSIASGVEEISSARKLQEELSK